MLDPLDIGWVVSGEAPERQASNRYMAYIPAATLGGRVWRCDPGDDPAALLDRYRPAALVIGKAHHAAAVRLCEIARTRGIAVLAALCDWHFDNPFNVALCRLADRLVVQTAAMAAAVERHLGRRPAIVEEPFEGPRGQPRFSPGDPPKLLWYGRATNLDTLPPGIAQIGARPGPPLALRIVTSQPALVDRVLPRLPPLRRTIQVTVEGWSLERQWQLLEDCDLVLLPSLDDRRKVVKGHNRLVQAIHAGRLALAHPLPPYRELADFCWCGPDLGEGLAWAVANPAAALARIVAGQAAIDRRFAPARIAGRWREEIEAALRDSRRSRS